MGAILYGDSGSEKAMYVDQTIALQDISEFYRSTSGLLAGYQEMGNNKSFWYFVRKYNSRGGGYLSGYSDINNNCLPITRLQNQPFHSICEFENNSELGTETIGEAIEYLDYNQAVRILSLLFKQMSNEGSNQVVYLTIGKWSGSEVGFVKAAMSYYRAILQVLPLKLQKRISFFVNTAPTKIGVSAYHTQLQFYTPEYMKSFIGAWFDCTEQYTDKNKFHPYILELAKDLVESKENHTLDAFENCIQFPYSSTRPYPIQLYLDLYDFLKLLESYDPRCTDLEFEVFCQKIELLWGNLRSQNNLNIELFLEKIKGCYPFFSDEIQAIEDDFQTVEKKQKEANYYRDLLQMKKQSLTDISQHLDLCIEEQLERYNQLEASINDVNQAYEDASMDYNYAQSLLQEENLLLDKLKEKWSRVRKKRDETKEKVTEILGKGENALNTLTTEQMASLAFKDLGNKCVDLGSKLEASPRISRWKETFPPKSSQPRNKQFGPRELKSAIKKVMVKKSVNSESCEQEIAEEGLCLYFRFCSNFLVELAPESQFCSFSFLVNNKRTMEFIEIVFPMLGALLIAYNEPFPDYLKNAYSNNREKAKYEGRVPEYPQLTMYFLLLLCGFLLLNFPDDNIKFENNQIDKRVRKLLPQLRECIKVAMSLFDSKDEAIDCFKKISSYNYLNLERFKLLK